MSVGFEAPRIDAHAHIWDPAERDYAWLCPGDEVLHRRYDADELRAASERMRIAGVVIVQAAAAEEESRALLRMAAWRREVLGVVGWVDVDAPDVGQAITRLRAAPGGERLVGVRIDALRRDPHWLAAPKVVACLAQISACGLALELLVDAARASSVLRLAEALPHARIVIDHLAHPPSSVRELPGWSKAIGALARCERTYVKLSALATLRPERPSRSSFLNRVVAAGLAAFGAHRMMFGSDWPVCLTSCTHNEVVALAAELLDDLAPSEQEQVWRRTAEAAYQLSPR